MTNSRNGENRFFQLSNYFNYPLIHDVARLLAVLAPVPGEVGAAGGELGGAPGPPTAPDAARTQ